MFPKHVVFYNIQDMKMLRLVVWNLNDLLYSCHTTLYILLTYIFLIYIIVWISIHIVRSHHFIRSIFIDRLFDIFRWKSLPFVKFSSGHWKSLFLFEIYSYIWFMCMYCLYPVSHVYDCPFTNKNVQTWSNEYLLFFLDFWFWIKFEKK